MSDELIHGWWRPSRLQSQGPNGVLCLSTSAFRGRAGLRSLILSNSLERLQARCDWLLWESEGRVTIVAYREAHIKKTLRVTVKYLSISGVQIMATSGNFVTLRLKSLGLKKLGSYGETTGLSQPLIPVQGLLFVFVWDPCRAQAYLCRWLSILLPLFMMSVFSYCREWSHSS